MSIQTNQNSNMKLTEEQAAMFAEQLEIAVQQQPEAAVLRDILLAIGGIEVLVPTFPSPEIPLLVNAGFLMTGAVKQLRMGRLGCAEYVAKLWGKKEVQLTGIGTGLALNENGFWVWHVWGLTGDTIIETECGLALLKYFGRVLHGEEAEQFASLYAPRRRHRAKLTSAKYPVVRGRIASARPDNPPVGATKDN
jgi:hypothetical protein